MNPSVAIVGGGIAGAASACHLASSGLRVTLLEREAAAHDKVCGEFLSGEAAGRLESLGGPPPALGAVPIERVRLVSGRREAVAVLPFPAWGLSRRRLDAWLLEQAERHGAAVHRGSAVRALVPDGAGVRVASDAAGSFSADIGLLATGKHELRGWRRPDGSSFIGLKQHLRLAEAQRRPVAGHVELALFAGGYAGLQLVEDGIANLCLVVTRQRYAALGRDWRQLVATVPHLAARLDGSSALWPRPLAVAGMPYGFLHRDGGPGPIYRVGDQVAVIPSFTGDGMAMALHSARLAADAITSGRPASAYHRDVIRSLRAPVRVATAVAAASQTSWAQAGLAAFAQLAPGLITGIAARTRMPA